MNKKKKSILIILAFLGLFFILKISISMKKIEKYTVLNSYESLTFSEKIAYKLKGYAKPKTNKELCDSGLIRESKKEEPKQNTDNEAPVKADWIALSSGTSKNKVIYFNEAIVSASYIHEGMPVMTLTENIGDNQYGAYELWLINNKDMLDKNNNIIKDGATIKIDRSIYSYKENSLPIIMASKNNIEIINMSNNK